MEPWLQAESRIRREEVLKTSRRVSASRPARGRTRNLRVRIAAGAQAVSDAFAGLAQRLRSGETG
jgi:hypothetical protein